METNDSTDTIHCANNRKWWQWFLLYPTLIISLLGSIPTFVELIQSTRMNVQFGDSQKAKMNNEMWRKNMKCGAAPLDPLITERNIEVDATICKSGDVLIRVMSPGDKTFFE